MYSATNADDGGYLVIDDTGKERAKITDIRVAVCRLAGAYEACDKSYELLKKIWETSRGDLPCKISGELCEYLMSPPFNYVDMQIPGAREAVGADAELKKEFFDYFRKSYG